MTCSALSLMPIDSEVPTLTYLPAVTAILSKTKALCGRRRNHKDVPVRQATSWHHSNKYMTACCQTSFVQNLAGFVLLDPRNLSVRVGDVPPFAVIQQMPKHCRPAHFGHKQHRRET